MFWETHMKKIVSSSISKTSGLFDDPHLDSGPFEPSQLHEPDDSEFRRIEQSVVDESQGMNFNSQRLEVYTDALRDQLRDFMQSENSDLQPEDAIQILQTLVMELEQQ